VPAAFVPCGLASNSPFVDAYTPWSSKLSAPIPVPLSTFRTYDNPTYPLRPPRNHTPQQEIRQAISKSDTQALSQVMQKAYASTFTAAELAFIADYSNSEIGKRVQRKMSQYVAKVKEERMEEGRDGGRAGMAPTHTQRNSPTFHSTSPPPAPSFPFK